MGPAPAGGSRASEAGAGEVGTKALTNPHLLAGDLFPGELVDLAPEVLQFVAPLGIPGALGGRRAPAAAGDLDDDTLILEEEVHAGDVFPVASVDHLGTRTWEAGTSHQAEEPPFQR